LTNLAPKKKNKKENKTMGQTMVAVVNFKCRCVKCPSTDEEE
jgi:hypothetical protein